MDLTKEIKNLANTYGPDLVMVAVQAVLGQPERGCTIEAAELKPLEMVITVSPELAELQKRRPLEIPAEWVHLVNPDQLFDTLNQLNGTGQALTEAGNAKARATNGKGDLLKKQQTTKTAIKLTEAEAIMQIQGTGKDAYVMVGDARQPVGTEQMKDAYRRSMSKWRREELADIDGDLMKLEADAISKTDDWNTAKEAAENARARAYLQARILEYMAPRG